LAENLGIRLY